MGLEELVNSLFLRKEGWTVLKAAVCVFESHDPYEVIMKWMLLLICASCSYQKDIWYELSDREVEQRLIEINDTLIQIHDEMQMRPCYESD